VRRPDSALLEFGSAVVWSRQSGEWHYHGPAEVHRKAPWPDSSSSYWRRGYNLALNEKGTISNDLPQEVDQPFIVRRCCASVAAAWRRQVQLTDERLASGYRPSEGYGVLR
jgi:hypothetical protein